jgi:sec-independent protein translocase protein TatB
MIRAMFGFGGFGGEVIFIFLLALLIFGPEKLPEIGRILAKTIGEVRRASNDLKRTLNAELAIHEQEQESRRQAVQPPPFAPPLRVVPPVAESAVSAAPDGAVPAVAAANTTVPFPSSIASPASFASPAAPANTAQHPAATVPQSAAPALPMAAGTAGSAASAGSAGANGGGAAAGLLSPYGDGGEPPAGEAAEASGGVDAAAAADALGTAGAAGAGR